MAASFTVEGQPCERGLDVMPVERQGFGLSRKIRVKPALVEQEASSGLGKLRRDRSRSLQIPTQGGAPQAAQMQALIAARGW